MPGFLNSIIADARPRPEVVSNHMQEHAGLSRAMEGPFHAESEHLAMEENSLKNAHSEKPIDTPPASQMTEQTNVSGLNPTFAHNKQAGAQPTSGKQSQKLPLENSRQVSSSVEKDISIDRPEVVPVSDKIKGSTQTVQGVNEDRQQELGKLLLITKSNYPESAEIQGAISSDNKIFHANKKDNKNISYYVLEEESRSASVKPLETTEHKPSINSDTHINPYDTIHEAAVVQQPVEQVAAQSMQSFEIDSSKVKSYIGQLHNEESVNDQAGIEARHESTVINDVGDRYQSSVTDDKVSSFAQESAPMVNIGQIDIVVQTEPNKAIPRQTEQHGHADFSSRNYLRRLL